MKAPDKRVQILAAFLVLCTLGCLYSLVGCAPKYWEHSKNLAKDADGTREVKFFKIDCRNSENFDILWYIYYRKLPPEEEQQKVCNSRD